MPKLSTLETNKHGQVKFKDLANGDEFHMDRCPESGLIIDLHKPGRYVYRKISARKQVCVGYGDVRFADDDAFDQLRPQFASDEFCQRFIDAAKINRSGRVGSITLEVWPL